MAYELVVIGTSVLWGQGLRDDQKIHSQVKTLLEASGKSLRGSAPIHVCLLAHSGALIGFKDDETVDATTKERIHGEVPTEYPTLLQQLAEYDLVTGAVPPEEVDAVLIEGSINDVNIIDIFDPMTTSQQLKQRIQRYCYRHMALLLERVAAKFARARIVVPAYYPMLSEQSEDTYLSDFLRSLGAVSGGRLSGLPITLLSDLAKGRILKNTAQFYEQSRLALQDAVDEVNAELKGKPRISLAVPSFTENNTVFAPDPWLFGMNPDLSPQDELAAERAIACDEAGEMRTVVPVCKCASNGHPNTRGAEAYAEAIVAELLR